MLMIERLTRCWICFQRITECWNALLHVSKKHTAGRYRCSYGEIQLFPFNVSSYICKVHIERDLELTFVWIMFYMIYQIDYEKNEEGWVKNIRSSVDDWNGILETILQWSPFGTESDLLQQVKSLSDHCYCSSSSPCWSALISLTPLQFDTLKEQGTRIIVYNLWEDDEGKMELDFETDPHVSTHTCVLIVKEFRNVKHGACLANILKY